LALPSLAFCLLVLLAAAALAATEDESNTTNPEDDGDGEEHEEESEPAFAVLFPWFSEAVGVVVFFVLTRYMHALPYTGVMFIIGVFMGVGAIRSGLQDQLTQSINAWIGIDSEVLFTVFLPGLLFKDAIELNYHLFQASFWQLITLAFPMVLVGTFLTACVARYVLFLNDPQWSWPLAMTFGSILAATDPVAVAALLNEVGAPPRLKIHIAGESLLNDGSAVVFFTVFSAMFLTELGLKDVDASFLWGLKIFLRMALGGTAIGIAFAIGLIGILYKLDRQLEREETLLQVVATVTVAYLSFYTSEVVCKMSGVIAVVMTGIVTKAFGGHLISDWQVMDSFWSLLEHLLNTLLFTLGGIVFGEIISDATEWQAQDWGYLFVLYIFVNLIRFFCLWAFYPAISRMGLKTNWPEIIFSGWAGLRGAVGIALALGLDNKVQAETNDESAIVLTSKVFGCVGGVAFLTLVINGTLSGPLLTKLHLADSTEDRKRVVKCAENAVKRRMLADFIHLMTDRRYYFVDFALVQYHCPLLSNVTAKELEEAVTANKGDVRPSLYKKPHLEHVLVYIPDAANLRQTITRSERDVFMGMVGVEDLTSTEDFCARSISEEGAEAPPSLVQDIRVMFIELLRAAYTAQIRDGELDAREYNGFLSYVLLQSLDFAHDNVMSGGPLNDWTASQLVTPELIDKTEDWFKRFQSCCLQKPKDQQGISASLSTLRDEEPLHYQQLRLDVLRAFSFIDAHREAQDRLNDEFGDRKGEMISAFSIVMDESKAQVKEATDVLRAKKKNRLDHVISHHFCIILQNKAASYIKQLLEAGVLSQREARHYLDQIGHQIIGIRHCKMEKHPGSIDFNEVEEVRDSMTRRKRVKQKSIL
jgi:NhaP-type Na+/H+ or K+/H+ antiporter